MCKEYGYIKLINIIYSIIQFVFIYIAGFFIEGPLYKNWFSVVVGVILLLIIAYGTVFINLLMKYKIMKKYNSFNNYYLLWMIIPIGLFIIQVLNIVL